jgi:hypothetical protein
MTLPVFLQNHLGKHSLKAQALLDGGATANFIKYRLVHKFKMTTIPLEKEIIVRNVDDTENILGRVKEKVYLHMRMGSHKEVLRLFVIRKTTPSYISTHRSLQELTGAY